MLEAKLTKKGQITIPIAICRMLNVKSGDQISFRITEHGVVIEKSDRPLTIQERFADYNISTSKSELEANMKEFDMGGDIGEERI
jgi:AbrB family looped-hinge helix DNA binding protein